MSERIGRRHERNGVPAFNFRGSLLHSVLGQPGFARVNREQVREERTIMTCNSVVTRLCLAPLLFANLTLLTWADEIPAYKPPTDFVAKTDEYMNTRYRVNRFCGAVLVAYEGRPILRAGYGLANHEFDIPNTLDTKL